MKNDPPRLARTVLVVVAAILLFTACKNQHSTTIPAGRGELLASGKALGETWRIYCGIDPSENGYSFDPAPVNACAPGGNPHPCVQAEFRGSSMVRCQLEDLTKKVLISHSFPVGDDQFLFFGVTDSRVASLAFELISGSTMGVQLLEPSNAAFKVFAVALSKTKASQLKRPIIKDAAGRDVA